MPKYRVTTYIIDEWSCDFEAENEEAARAMAYDESKPDIGPDQYVQQTVHELIED